jgi:hypothetical protein
MPAFKYGPLDPKKRQIRLIKILPLELDSPEVLLANPAQLTTTPFTNAQGLLVTCTIEVVSLDDNPEYLALSYTWGPSVYKMIQLGYADCVNRKPFPVTANLEEALRYLRQEKHTVCLWADAICIDQTNNMERTEQVLLMRDIYGKSTSALVWLGPAADDSNAVMDGLDRVGKEALEAGILKLRKDDFLNWPRPDPEGRRNAIQIAVDDLAEQNGIEFPHQALKILSERNYWTRVWIVQEIAVPRKVMFMCGDKQLAFDTFAAAILFLPLRSNAALRNVTTPNLPLITKLSTHPSPALGVLIGARRRYQRETGVPETLMELLVRGCIVASSSHSDRQATDPRDRIYGLLGLASDKNMLNIRPDYSKTLVESYTNVARTLIQHGFTDILAWCQGSKKLKDLPSWVPDFSTPIRDPCGVTQKFGLFSASGQRGVSTLPMDSCYGSNVLALTGTVVDTIMKTGSLWTPGLDCVFDYTAAKSLFADIETFCQEAQRRPFAMLHDSKKFAEAIWRIPCADQVFTENVLRRRASSPEGYHELKYRVAQYPMVYNFQSPACQGYLIAMEYLHNRRPFISTEGYVGLIPAHSKPGDLVCIIFGATIPFVLRRLQGGQHGLIGEAYVYGIMDGEYMQTSPLSETFHLC